MTLLKNKDFWVAVSIIILTICLIIMVNQRIIRFNELIGPFRVSHWFALIGTIYIAFTVPIIAVLKKRSPNRYLPLFRAHIFGNLIGFLLISLHFAGQISRSPTSYPDLGTGLTLYIVMLLLVATGFTHRFQLLPQITAQTRKFIHVGTSFSFYIIIGIHILQGLGFI